MAKITKTFSFKVPDDYTLQEALNDSSVSFTYHGPAYLRVQINPAGTMEGVESITLDEWVAELKENGIEFDQDPKDEKYLWREAVLHDPSGNKIKLYWAGENRLNPPWRVEKRS